MMTLHAQVQDLLARARSTDALPIKDQRRAALQILERREALQLLTLQEIKIETMAREYTALSSRVFELAKLVTRGTNGHDWLKDFPHRENAAPFYQHMRALVKFLHDRSKPS